MIRWAYTHSSLAVLSVVMVCHSVTCRVRQAIENKLPMFIHCGSRLASWNKSKWERTQCNDDACPSERYEIKESRQSVVICNRIRLQRRKKKEQYLFSFTLVHYLFSATLMFSSSCLFDCFRKTAIFFSHLWSLPVLVCRLSCPTGFRTIYYEPTRIRGKNNLYTQTSSECIVVLSILNEYRIIYMVSTKTNDSHTNAQAHTVSMRLKSVVFFFTYAEIPFCRVLKQIYVIHPMHPNTVHK